MNLKLIKLTKEYEAQLGEMLEEWTADIEANHTNHSPWTIFRNDYHDFDYYLTGGHIGDGIRPSERGKGYGTELVRLALIECKKLGIHRVLMTCDKDNIASAKTILRNGGVLENEVVNEEGEIEQRYWIEL